MYVLYVDELFVQNLLIDYLLLLATAKVAGLPAKRSRLALAAVLGGLYAAFAALAGSSPLSSPALKVTVGLLMVLIVFGAAERLLRTALIFLGVSAAFAGAVMAATLVRGEDTGLLYPGGVSFSSLILSFAGFYVLFSAAFRFTARRRLRGEVGRLTVTFGGRSVTVSALADTGNGLREPGTGLPVAVCSLESLSPLFEKDVLRVLTEHPDPAEALEELGRLQVYSFFLVPCRTVGKSAGMLLAFRPQGLRHGSRELTALVAIDPEGLNDAAGYSAIVGV